MNKLTHILLIAGLLCGCKDDEPEVATINVIAKIKECGHRGCYYKLVGLDEGKYRSFWVDYDVYDIVNNGDTLTIQLYSYGLNSRVSDILSLNKTKPQ